jgi:hypothetical protein
MSRINGLSIIDERIGPNLGPKMSCNARRTRWPMIASEASGRTETRCQAGEGWTGRSTGRTARWDPRLAVEIPTGPDFWNRARLVQRLNFEKGTEPAKN